MSLDWDISKVKNYEELCFDTEGDMNPLTSALINATTAIGMLRITEKNFEEFHLRLLEEAKSTGKGRLYYFDKEFNVVWVNPTLKEVQDHIGLFTSATQFGGSKTRKQWEAQLKRKQVSANS
jgi:hypothetical protein